MDICIAAKTDPFAAEPGKGDDPQLVYVSDTDNGIFRRRAGKGFTYKRPDGARVKDPGTLKRIRSLAIPPAWTEVWICPHANGHIQATGRDQRGRKQYRYHPDWTAFRGELKFASLVDFAERLPALRARVDTDLARSGIPREKVLAVVVRLLDKTLIRIGNDNYRRENRSFGLTTLSSKHVATGSSFIRFAFRGKSGREWKLKLVDRRIARIIATIEDLPGQHLFQYVEGKQRVPVHSHDVNEYIREATGKEFTSKHFRTWAGTTLATVMLADAERPLAKRTRTQTANQVIDRVAQELRNTRAVCRKGYIHPVVLETWEAGTLADEIKELRRRFRKPLTGLDEEESLVLRWLRTINQQED